MQIENMKSVKTQILKLANVNAVYRKGDKLIAHVTKKLPLDQLKKKDIVPKTVNGLKTDVVEKGKISYYQRHRPLIGGISCIESNFGAGTLGCIVRDALDGALVGLTCNHCAGTYFDINYTWPVYGNTALSHIEMRQPSFNDGGTTSVDTIGAPKRAVATQFGEDGENYVDAAIINLPVNQMKTDILGINRGPFPFLLESFDYAPGTIVYKMGRTSGLTEGVISALDAAVLVTNSDGDEAYYYDQILIESTEAFGLGGDSGSVILTYTLGIWKIIGLLYGGNTEGTLSFANHIGDIATLLNIESWNGDIIAETEADYLLVNGICYKYKGFTTDQLTHNSQRIYTSQESCFNNTYPKDKVQTVS